MLTHVNKKTAMRKTVKYAALSSGTISHVWCDDEQMNANVGTAKRKNHILLNSEKSQKAKNYDA